ncbi:MAG: hypothetical protein ACI8Y4_003386 [Candidatus Poriferisodalaceae bacterium]|jgi:hypothetical protein
MPMDRRTFLTGSAAAIALAACGTSSPSQSAISAAPVGALQVAQLFSSNRVIGATANQRLAFALIGDDGPLRGDDADASVQLLDANGTVIDETTVRARVATHTHVGPTSHDHPDGFRYYAPRLEFQTPGAHRLFIESPEGQGELSVHAFAESELLLPGPGAPFPSLVTPTVANAAGVDTLCTRTPDCLFHSISADAALTTGAPFVVLIATPAYCQTQLCGPVLEVLIEAAPSIATIHVEVWANPAAVDGNIADAAIRPAPVIVDLGHTFEPVLFVVGADGVIRERLDNLFDSEELTAALAMADELPT